jgi:hypothetical protein
MLKRFVGRQERRVDHPSVQHQIQERPLGIGEGQYSAQTFAAFLYEARPAFS